MSSLRGYEQGLSSGRARAGGTGSFPLLRPRPAWGRASLMFLSRRLSEPLSLRRLCRCEPPPSPTLRSRVNLFPDGLLNCTTGRSCFRGLPSASNQLTNGEELGPGHWPASRSDASPSRAPCAVAAAVRTAGSRAVASSSFRLAVPSWVGGTPLRGVAASRLSAGRRAVRPLSASRR